MKGEKMNYELSREQKEIIKASRDFAKAEFSEKAEEFDREETFDLDIWKNACELGFVGVWIEEEYEGFGMSLLDHCLIMEEFTAVDPGIAIAILSTAFGSEIIQEYGTETQKKKYLPPIAKGEAIMGAALTEPDAGSDLLAASTTAVKIGNECSDRSRQFR